VSSNKQYIQKIRKGENYFEVEKLTKNQKYNEYIFTSLRIIWGVNSEIIKDRFGEKRKTRFLKEVKKWEQKTYVKQKEKVFTLTKKGQIFADRIASDLFIV
jgi:oxygen-independent coproporphyrinogen-3 oxidase